MFHVFVVVLLVEVRLNYSGKHTYHYIYCCFCIMVMLFPMVSLLSAFYLEYKNTTELSCFIKKFSVLTFCLNDVRHVESVVHPQYEYSILKVKGIAVRKEKRMRRTALISVICITACVSAPCVWVLLHYSHIALHHLCAGISPVALKTHHQRVWLHTAEPGCLSRAIKNMSVIILTRRKTRFCFTTRNYEQITQHILACRGTTAVVLINYSF